MSVPVNKRSKAKTEVFLKARDLLDYTLTITANTKKFRPDLNDSVKTLNDNDGEVFGTINRLLDVVDALNSPTENIYVWIINNLRQSANDIFIYSWRANNIRVNANPVDRDLRLQYQRMAIDACNDLEVYISLAKRKCHLKTQRVVYWHSKVREVKKELTAWHNADVQRYKDIK